MNALEQLLAKYPSSIATIASLATVVAVIVALYLARRQSRPRLKIFVDVRHYISTEAQLESDTIDPIDAPRKISVTIFNIGPVPVSIMYWSSFYWRVFGSKQAGIQNPAEPTFRSKPIELLPGKSATIVLSDDLNAHTEMLKRLAAKSWLGRTALRFPSLTASTEVGDRFRAKMRKSLRVLSRSA